MKFIRNLKNKLTNAVNSMAIRTRTAVANTRGEGYVDSGVKILIAVVIGALLLTLLYGLFSNRIFPTLTEKINGLFDYEG